MTECGNTTCGCGEEKCGQGSCNDENCTCGKESSDKKNNNELNHVKHVVAVMSGKGGVGKSTVTALLASAFRKKGFKVGILDADITGPSIPKLFGLKDSPKSTGCGLLPVKSTESIEIMSLNLFLPSEDEPVIWRGPIISGVIKQFWEEVIWGDLDYLFVDLPPGTGDAPLTVLQSLPLDGVVIVTSPQDLANMVVRKAIKMAEKMDIPILGIVENMSYVQCPDCGKKIFPFGQGKVELMCQEFKVPLLGILPLEPSVSAFGDQGKIGESASSDLLRTDLLLEILEK
ncbi:P-loop NTPase [Thermanaerosceptrum fracticalcis]|uniref:Iron-sulfur cluster carrier protein n=1 Tax=Thermanaerosceptrum fracticalcis TaxID=1712410 RepID=A0A7G6E3A4_THEFR|nr:Mrp/NBP35 family ATP-binding protein [Thermanaerosceptrum fracticalcis]QNB46558.1 P-loop NTPase [Thermanaerosceptrum fracticalcis]